MNICYTGGGTGGHIFPIFPIDEELKKKNPSVKRFYIGRISELEQSWVEKEGIEYYGIQSGKLRRYHSFQNVTDIFRIIFGFFQALTLLRKNRPSIVFSKGGYVSVPVVIAAYILRIQCICHESDATPGLANRISIIFATTMCVAHEDVKKYFPLKQRPKCLVTGVPTRMNKGKCIQQKAYPHPLIAIFGGSLGAQNINELVAPIMNELTTISYVVHQTGVGKGISASYPRYERYEFIEDEYINILGQADIVISRSGATALADYVEMEVPSILIPLGRDASRGDQILNAKRLEHTGGAIVLYSETLTSEQLLETIQKVLEDTHRLEKMREQLRGRRSQRVETLIASIILDTVD